MKNRLGSDGFATLALTLNMPIDLASIFFFQMQFSGAWVRSQQIKANTRGETGEAVKLRMENGALNTVRESRLSVLLVPFPPRLNSRS